MTTPPPAPSQTPTVPVPMALVQAVVVAVLAGGGSYFGSHSDDGVMAVRMEQLADKLDKGFQRIEDAQRRTEGRVDDLEERIRALEGRGGE